MIAWLDSWCRRVTDSRPMRRVLESCLRRRAGRSLSLLGGDPRGKAQARLLRGLIHRARHTAFGKDHDFARARTVADFRRLVPLTTPADLVRRYLEPAFPWLDRATWPEVLRVVEAPLPGCSYLPLTRAFAARSAEAWLVGLAQVLAAYPRRRLLAGRVLGVVDPAGEPLTAAAWSRLPWSLQPYLHPRHASQVGPDDFRAPTTCLLGSREQLTALVARVRETTGHARLTDVWPDLMGVVYLGSPRDRTPPEGLLAALDRRVVVREVLAGPDGVVAAEEPRGGLRLLAECGVFYELLAADDRSQDQPARRGLDEAEPGRVYELATTTPSGLWACRIGVGVCFDAVGRVRFEPLPALPPVVAEPEPPPVPVKPPRVRPAGGVPTAAPEGLARLPWSSPAER